MAIQNDRRENNRVQARLAVEAQILFPEDTFQPKIYKGLTENLNKTGMMITLFNFDIDTFKKLLRYPRYIKIRLEELQQFVDTPLIGRVIWIDFHYNKEEAPLCKIGLHFDSLLPEQEKKLFNLLDILQEGIDKKSE